MIDGKRILAIIPARGGSKGVPRKNIRDLGGKPLIAWTIEEAKKSRYIDRLVLSSEDAEIIAVAKAWGCEGPFVRPLELAQDDTPGIAPVLHALELLPDYDYVVLLQPTSPLRRVEDIDGCIELCLTKQADSCVSVTETDKSPYWMYTLAADAVMLPVIPTEKQITRRQDAPAVYALNGAVYVARTAWLRKSKSFVMANTVAYPMPKERALDIDTELDFAFVQTVITCGKYNADMDR